MAQTCNSSIAFANGIMSRLIVEIKLIMQIYLDTETRILHRMLFAVMVLIVV